MSHLTEVPICRKRAFVAPSNAHVAVAILLKQQQKPPVLCKIFDFPQFFQAKPMAAMPLLWPTFFHNALNWCFENYLHFPRMEKLPFMRPIEKFAQNKPFLTHKRDNH